MRSSLSLLSPQRWHVPIPYFLDEVAPYMLLVRYLPFEGDVARWFLSCRPLSVPVDGLPDPLAVRGDLTSAEGASVFAILQDHRSLELVNHLCPLTGQRPDQAERLHHRAAQGTD